MQLLLIPKGNSMMWGVYEDFVLEAKGSEDGKALDSLVQILVRLQAVYKISSIFYARGPGSFVSLKLLHIFVHTLCCTRQIPVFATDSFYFDSSPIPAFSRQYFIKKEEGDVVLSEIKGEIKLYSPILPEVLICEDFCQETVPLYVLSPV